MGNRKNILVPYLITSAGSMTGTATITGTAIDISYLDNVSFQATWTGTPNGSFDVQGSIDGTNYQSVTLSSTPTATGSAGTHLISLALIPFKYVRLNYTNTSSTGTLNVYVMAKGL